MRSVMLLASSALPIALASYGAAPTSADGGSRLAPVTVTIHVECVSASAAVPHPYIKVWVDPWRVVAHSASSDHIVWQVDSPSTGQYKVSVEALDEQAWPFQNPSGPVGLNGQASNTFDSGPMNGLGTGAVSSYKVHARCTIGKSVVKVDIDPDVTIDPAGSINPNKKPDTQKTATKKP